MAVRWSRRARRWVGPGLDVTLWTMIGAAGLIVGSQIAGWHGNAVVASAQSLTPYVVLALVPTTLAAHAVRRHLAGITSSVFGVAGLAVVAPLVFVTSPPADEDATGVTIASINLLYTNDEVGAAADVLAELDLDAIVFTEYTAQHHDALSGSMLAHRYPFRLAKPGPGAEGVALWSRIRFDQRVGPRTVNNNVDVLVDGPDGPFRLLGVHTPTPVYDFEPWVRDLETIAEASAVTPTTPTLVLGDFNASYWHPGFRAILDLGFTDAHAVAGRGFSASWPAGGTLPAFVRLDHALTGHGLVSMQVRDFEIPGSDHTGFEVTVAPARPAAPGTLAHGG